MAVVLSPLLAASVVATPAVASEVSGAGAKTTAVVPADTFADRAGDVPLQQGDILAAGFTATSTSLVFGVKVATPTDPAIDDAWSVGRAFAYWDLDTNHDTIPEYHILLLTDGNGGTSATVSHLTDTGADIVCNGPGTYIATYGYTATLPKDCLPAGLSFGFEAAMSYTGATGPSQPTDFAPAQSAYGPTVTTPVPVIPVPPVPVTPKGGAPSGHWMLGADGHVYSFGGAVASSALQPGAAAMAPRRDGKGYWVTDGRGTVRAFGTAAVHGGAPVLGPAETITTIAATRSGNGYWLFSNRGRAFAYGDARLFGDLSNLHLNGAIVASAPTGSGQGYLMVGRDGGIFAFGDAQFHGSTGAMRLNQPIVGIAPTPTGSGYWLVGSDGCVFAFNAPFRGSMGAARLNRPVDGLVAYGNGYLMAASDGGVFDFSNRAFAGSLAAHAPVAPIIGLAAFGS